MKANGQHVFEGHISIYQSTAPRLFEYSKRFQKLQLQSPGLHAQLFTLTYNTLCQVLRSHFINSSPHDVIMLWYCFHLLF